MNYTDRFFEFPVRIYDRFQTEQAIEQEEREKVPIDGVWAAGKSKLPFQEISSWSDYYDSEQGIEGVKQKGFEYTIVWTHNEGAYICTWERKKFEEKLNAFVEKYEQWASDKLDFLVDEIEKLQQNKV